MSVTIAGSARRLPAGGLLLTLLALVVAAAPARAEQRPALSILSQRVPAGHAQRVTLDLTESFSGVQVSTPVLVAHGVSPGPTLCLVAGIHGDELNGIETVRRVMQRADPSDLSGTLLAVPIANPPALRRGSRYLPDRRDLNRHFPGSPRGSLAERIANRLFGEVIRNCSHLVDLHSGSDKRSNLPQVRGDARNASVRDMLRAFGLTAIHHKGGQGTLRRAATDAGVHAVVLEAGEANRLDESDIMAGVLGIANLQRALSMARPGEASALTEAPALFTRSRWIRADSGGILLREIELGEDVRAGTLLGRIVDPLEGHVTDVVAPEDGRIVGRAANQLVMPGFGIFHVAMDPLAPGAAP